MHDDNTHTPLVAGLYLVATPIGADGDLTLRAQDVLRRATLIAAEDTRRARRLLRVHDVSIEGRRIVAYHDHSDARARSRLIDHVADGGALAYVSDAGTPLVADPGYRLVEDCHARELKVVALPGPSAVLAALSVAGLPTERFMFVGFLPTKDGARRKEIAALAGIPATLVIYEAPHRIEAVMAALADGFGGDRPAALCRELTKTYEEVRRGTLEQILEGVRQDPPRGEIAVVVGPPSAGDQDAEAGDLDDLLVEAMTTLSVSAAVRSVAALTGLPRKTVYGRALDLRGDDEDDGR